jgi:MoaA/NifB/PqqE/SkfB family radical SAM enzyme
MKEWSNPWNPFNSAKVLLWKEHLDACAKEEYLPPVTVDIDPSNKCMFDCPHCNAYDMMQHSSENMSGDHMLKLVRFLASWRETTRHHTPMSACISGGGEPYMNKEMTTLLEAMYGNEMESGIITTGFPMTDKDIDVAAITARWVGFSVDAATSETYNKIKGIRNDNALKKVLENIKKLVKRVEHHKSKCDVAFKYLLTPDNAFEVYDAIKLAKEIGVKDFHLRPAGWDNLSKVKDKPEYSVMDISKINYQIEQGMLLATKDFRVFGIRHKFNPDFSRKINFSRCWAIPLIPTFGADGNVHLCFDMRGREDLILCRHDPDPYELMRFWNTDKHREIIRSVKVEDCPRCTFGAYNEIVEKVIIDDSMCKYFP